MILDEKLRKMNDEVARELLCIAHTAEDIKKIKELKKQETQKNNNSKQRTSICENQNCKNKSLKCTIKIKNIDKFIEHAIRMKSKNKPIEDILNFEFEFCA